MDASETDGVIHGMDVRDLPGPARDAIRKSESPRLRKEFAKAMRHAIALEVWAKEPITLVGWLTSERWPPEQLYESMSTKRQ